VEDKQKGGGTGEGRVPECVVCEVPACGVHEEVALRAPIVGEERGPAVVP
jgi:hypothetical protein